MANQAASLAALPPRPVIDWAAKLAECLAPLAAEAFPIQSWTPNTLTRNFVTVRNFIKTVKILSKGNAFILTKLVHKGTLDGFWETPATCTVKQVYKYCVWLRSKDGAAFINHCRTLRRLEKWAFPVQRVAEDSLVAAFDTQMSEYSTKENEIRFRGEAELTELRRQEALKELELEEMKFGAVRGSLSKP